MEQRTSQVSTTRNWLISQDTSSEGRGGDDRASVCVEDGGAMVSRGAPFPTVEPLAEEPTGSQGESDMVNAHPPVSPRGT